jgi:hypothetical protein
MSSLLFKFRINSETIKSFKYLITGPTLTRCLPRQDNIIQTWTYNHIPSQIISVVEVAATVVVVAAAAVVAVIIAVTVVVVVVVAAVVIVVAAAAAASSAAEVVEAIAVVTN